MKIIIAYTQFVLATCLLNTAYGSWTYSNVQSGCVLVSGSSAIVSAKDQTWCLRRCFNSYGKACSAIAFNSSTSECGQFTSELSIRTSSDTAVVFTQWAKAVLILTPHRFEYAETLCSSSVRGRLMASHELEHAFNMGIALETCRCGWVTDGTPRIIRTSDCGPVIGFDTCSITNDKTRKTWCILN